MTTDPDLYALVLRLRPARGHGPPNPLGHGVHAMFLDLVRQIDPALAARLHADAPSKPFTVALLPGGPHAQRDAALELRVTFTTAELFPPVTQALLRQSLAATLRIGSVALELSDVFGTPEHHPWAGYDSFATLHERAEPAAALTLAFVTPAAFGQGTRADGRARLGLLPTPEAVFKSLARRWNELAPAALKVELAAVETVTNDTLVSRYQLESQQISLGKGPQKGFVGVCSYELPPDAAGARTLALLADAAFYLGVGMKTARGMGLCRRIERPGGPR
jgi:CRISPR-associated endoribonuclease Cas6